MGAAAFSCSIRIIIFPVMVSMSDTNIISSWEEETVDKDRVTTADMWGFKYFRSTELFRLEIYVFKKCAGICLLKAL